MTVLRARGVLLEHGLRILRLKRKTTHRMLDTSFPTLFAYAPCSLLSFVLRLILKNTSSPVELTTCISGASAFSPKSPLRKPDPAPVATHGPPPQQHEGVALLHAHPSAHPFNQPPLTRPSSPPNTPTSTHKKTPPHTLILIGAFGSSDFTCSSSCWPARFSSSDILNRVWVRAVSSVGVLIKKAF